MVERKAFVLMGLGVCSQVIVDMVIVGWTWQRELMLSLAWRRRGVAADSHGAPLSASKRTMFSSN